MKNSLFNYMTNKYVISFLIFILFILFFDQNSWISRYKYRKELDQLLKDKVFYQKEIEKTSSELKDFTDNDKTLEKFAREKYLMKKDNEDIFIIVSESE